jgi:hypothetical protein
MNQLLTREEFREAVFSRDRRLCVICHANAQDPHHIIERKLWPDGGYYLDNGASVCSNCHIKAEQTLITCEQLREAAGIKQTLLPPHLYDDTSTRYDKWGNNIMPDGRILRGELADDEQVKRILAGIIKFSKYIKYPRTHHLPWSPGRTKDDREIPSLNGLIGEEVVVTEKMDGENTTMYNDHIHARTIDSGNHPSRHRVKRLWASISYDIPENYRICGENLYAKHSIAYENLPGWFLVFATWRDLECLSWDETVEWASLLNLPTVPILYRGPFNEKTIQKLYKPGSEGYVVRPSGPFRYSQFRDKVGKFVRASHVQTHGHWMRQAIIPNRLHQEETTYSASKNPTPPKV